MGVLSRRVILLLGLAACAPGQAYEPPTTTAAVIRPARARPSAAVHPKREIPPTEVVRPAHEATTAQAAAAVLGAETTLPMLVVLPPTPATATLSRVLPPVDAGGELPGTLEVIASLHGPVGSLSPLSATAAPAGPMPQHFAFAWMFPFFPFGLARAGGR